MTTSTGSAARAPVTNGWTAARAYHGFLGLLVAASLVLQLVMAVQADGEPVSTRVIRFFSYFTVQSNLLVLAAMVTLAARPARDGGGWRVMRLDGILGITVTGLVYVTVLAPLREVPLEGANRLADTGLHYLSPLLAVVGWLLFGPRPRIEGRTVLLAMIWPVLWFAYTLLHGAASHWYPYPFIDVTALGYWGALRNAFFVTLLVFLIAGAYAWGDRWLRPRPNLVDQARR